MLSKIRLIFLLLILFLMIAGCFFVFNAVQNIFQKKDAVNLPSENSTKPWIEVVVPPVFEVKDGKEIKQLFTGDELYEGMSVRVYNSGFANIYFPDGSIARVDGGTELVLEESSFNSGNGKLIMRINLLLGRVWSKVISLATPDSVWEVKTSTAVATVRGTAFGMEYSNGKSTIIGSENKVAVSAIDPKTKKILKQAEVLIEAGKSVEIKKELAEQVASHLAKAEIQKQGGVAMTAAPAISIAEIIAVKEAPAEILKQGWVKKAIEADMKMNEKIREIKEVKKEVQEIRKEIRSEIRKEVKERAIEIKLEKEALKEVSSAKSEELLNRYETYKENPTKENLKNLLEEVPAALPEKLPEQILNNLPSKIPEPLMKIIPESIKPAIEEFLKDPEAARIQLINSWEAIKAGTENAVNNMDQEIQKTQEISVQNTTIIKPAAGSIMDPAIKPIIIEPIKTGAEPVTNTAVKSIQ